MAAKDKRAVACVRVTWLGRVWLASGTLFLSSSSSFFFLFFSFLFFPPESNVVFGGRGKDETLAEGQV